jgi:mannose-6-phosphate isomerase-like protein (cupin superfamily)
MPVITNQDAPRFERAGTHVVGLAAPSRGARETSAWRLTLLPGASSPDHTLDREEVFVALAGCARATLDGSAHDVRAGDGLIVPAGVAFTIANEGDEPFEAVACLPVGGSATVAGEPMTPPWAV